MLRAGYLLWVARWEASHPGKLKSTNFGVPSSRYYLLLIFVPSKTGAHRRYSVFVEEMLQAELQALFKISLGDPGRGSVRKEGSPSNDWEEPMKKDLVGLSKYLYFLNNYCGRWGTSKTDKQQMVLPFKKLIV